MRFAQNPHVVDEDSNVATLTVMRENPSGNEFNVDYVTTDGTATASSDYISNTGTITFADNEITKTLSITIQDDNIAEGEETILLTLSNATGGVQTAEQSAITLLIQDNDAPASTRPTLFMPQLSR